VTHDIRVQVDAVLGRNSARGTECLHLSTTILASHVKSRWPQNGRLGLEYCHLIHRVRRDAGWQWIGEKPGTGQTIRSFLRGSKHDSIVSFAVMNHDISVHHKPQLLLTVGSFMLDISNDQEHLSAAL